MNEVSEIQSKECIRCFEKISLKAKKCPHCQEWQRSFFTLNNPIFLFPLYIVGLFCFILAFIPILKTAIRVGTYKDYTGEIKVSKSEYFHTVIGDQMFLTVVGTLKNESKFRLSRITLEGNFFDSNKKLIGTINQEHYQLFLAPNSEANFEMRGFATFPKEAYSSFEVKVKKAEEQIL